VDNSTCSCNPGFLPDKDDPRNCLSCPSYLNCYSGNHAIISDSTVLLNNSINGQLIISNSLINITSVDLKDINIQESDINVLSNHNLSVVGNINTGYSFIELNAGSSVKITGNVVVSNAVWTISSSSNVNITGCLTLDNVTINVHDDGSSDNPVLLTYNASNGCSSDFDLSKVNIISDKNDPCTDTTVTAHQNNFVMTISLERTKTEYCLALPLWLIITISLACVIVLAVLIVIIVTCTSLSEEVFPFRFSGSQPEVL